MNTYCTALYVLSKLGPGLAFWKTCSNGQTEGGFPIRRDYVSNRDEDGDKHSRET